MASRATVSEFLDRESIQVVGCGVEIGARSATVECVATSSQMTLLDFTQRITLPDVAERLRA